MKEESKKGKYCVYCQIGSLFWNCLESKNVNEPFSKKIALCDDESKVCSTFSVFFFQYYPSVIIIFARREKSPSKRL